MDVALSRPEVLCPRPISLRFTDEARAARDEKMKGRPPPCPLHATRRRYRIITQGRYHWEGHVGTLDGRAADRHQSCTQVSQT